MGRATQRTYDIGGRLRTRTDPDGAVTTFTYDDFGNLLTVIAPSGAVTSREYDSAGNLIAEINPLGQRTRYSYDPLNRKIGVASPEGLITRFAYDNANRLSQVTSPAGRVTRFNFDSAGRRVSMSAPDGSATFYRYDAAGQLVEIIDPRGGKTKKEYDAEGRITATVEARGNAAGGDPQTYKTLYGYDAVGNLTSRADALGNKFTWTFDPDGFELNETTPRGNQPGALPGEFTTQNSFDLAGRQISVNPPGEGATIMTYDDDDQLIKRESSTGVVETFEFDPAGRVSAVIDGLGGRQTYEYDRDGHLIKSVDPRGNAAGANPDDFAWRWYYDAGGRLGEATNPIGAKTSYQYDRDGRLARMIGPQGWQSSDPNAFATTLTHNAFGELSSVRNPGGLTFELEYDPNGRIDAVKQPQTAERIDVLRNPTRQITRVSYASARGTHQSDLNWDIAGHLTKIDAPQGDIGFEIDAVGRVVAENRVAGSTTIGYDPDSNLAFRDFDGRVNTFGWNRAGMLASRRDGLLADTYTYDSDSRHSETINEAGNAAVFDYDGAGRASGVTVSTNVLAPPFLQWKVDRDRAGQITQIRDTVSGASRTFGYDAAGRLVTQSMPGSLGQIALNYELDRAGNRTSWRSSLDLAPTRFEYNVSGRVSAKIDPLSVRTTYAYNSSGMLVSSSGGEPATYDWNAIGQLTRLSKLAPEISFSYGPDGKLAQVSQALSTTTYRFAGRSLDAVDVNGTRLLTFKTTPDGLPISARVANGTRFFYQIDPIGNVERLTNEAGVTAVQYFYDAWGREVRTIQGPAWNSDLAANPFRYFAASQVLFEPKSGLYLGAGGATYDPGLGRYLSRESSLPVYGASPAGGRASTAPCPNPILTHLCSPGWLTPFIEDNLWDLIGATNGPLSTAYTYSDNIEYLAMSLVPNAWDVSGWNGFAYVQDPGAISRFDPGSQDGGGQTATSQPPCDGRYQGVETAVSSEQMQSFNLRHPDLSPAIKFAYSFYSCEETFSLRYNVKVKDASRSITTIEAKETIPDQSKYGDRSSYGYVFDWESTNDSKGSWKGSSWVRRQPQFLGPVGSMRPRGFWANVFATGRGSDPETGQAMGRRGWPTDNFPQRDLNAGTCWQTNGHRYWPDNTDNAFKCPHVVSGSEVRAK